MLDQTKSVFFVGLLYFVVVRRFGFLKPNEKEYLSAEVLATPKQENFLPKFKVFLLKVLESQAFETMSMTLISVYTVYILFWLTMAGLFNIADTTMSKGDLVFLSLFLTEIALKVFASNFMYFLDPFNLFDASIVIVSETLELLGIIFQGLGVLRLIRVVVITIRKITGNTSKLRHQTKNLNPVESVITLLQ